MPDFTVVITGSSGFLGRTLVSEILLQDSPVVPTRLILYDIHEGQACTDPRVQFVDGDVRNYDLLRRTLAGADLVIHSAAIVDWGTHPAGEITDVNLNGTKNVIRCCREAGVKALVFTSSLDAVYGGKELKNVDESLSYPDSFPNMYCESKCLAEKAVKEANGPSLKTCIIRPSDIYGEGDPYHIGSLMNMAKGGFYVRLGDGSARSQHTHVINCARGHLMAGKALLDGNPNVPGNAYFITDAPGTNFFKFYDRIVIESGQKIWPKNFWIPRGIAMAMGMISEAAAWLARPIYKYNPTFSRFAVIYTCSDFTFSSEKANKDFGFVPKITEEEAVRRTIEFYRSNQG
jgi:nucleoside-diphosphate-sugar epimerase